MPPGRPIQLRTDYRGDGLNPLIHACLAVGLSKLDGSVRPEQIARQRWNDYCGRSESCHTRP
jgi:hypothetical protein